jgi:hypothetical protein
LWYRHHVESVYCVAGEGEIENCETGEVHPISDGTLYWLDGHEKHILRAKTELRLVCVFTPALVGREIHDEEGAFPLLTEGADTTPSRWRPANLRPPCASSARLPCGSAGTAGRTSPQGPARARPLASGLGFPDVITLRWEAAA